MDNKFLFRGKRIDNGEWFEGYYRKTWVGQKYKHFISNDYDEWEIDPTTVGQYTGLKDKNGKFIFEGDKLFSENMLSYCTGKDDERFAVVQWDNNHDARYIGNMRTTCYNLSASKFHECEIIGNIHDTPDLVQSPQHRE